MDAVCPREALTGVTLNLVRAAAPPILRRAAVPPTFPTLMTATSAVPISPPNPHWLIIKFSTCHCLVFVLSYAYATAAFR